MQLLLKLTAFSIPIRTDTFIGAGRGLALAFIKKIKISETHSRVSNRSEPRTDAISNTREAFTMVSTMQQAHYMHTNYRNLLSIGIYIASNSAYLSSHPSVLCKFDILLHHA